MVTRRTFTQGLGVFSMAASIGRALPVRAEEPRSSPIIMTESGPVQGRVSDAIHAFLGIPYGAPTGGEARFMPPLPAKKWSSVRQAIAFGPTCPQVSLGVSPFLRSAPGQSPPPPSELQQQLAGLFPRANPEPPQNEDCLVLNVWTPAPDRSKRPVLIWIHGGGFAVGSASLPVYDGTHLSHRGDVVVVSINHRLNAFGYLYLGEIAGHAFSTSGNVGMLDIVAALRWVRDNIESFGGDPGNVTIFGESGGAGKVSVLCAMPVAKGLFHKAIMQSGPCLQIADKARGTAIAKQLLADLGLSASQVSELQRIDPMKLSAAANAAEIKVVPRVLGFGPLGMIPIVDGEVITHHPFDTQAAAESAHIPMMIGSTKDEAVLFAAPLPRWGQFTEAEILELARPMAGANSQQALDLYKKLHPQDSPSYLLVDIVTDFWMRQAANRVAELKTRQRGAPAFMYMLEWEVNPSLRTPHGTDVSLVFDNIDASQAMSRAEGARGLAEQMSDAWIAFARTGAPQTPQLPHWPAYTLERRANMLFNSKSRVVDDYGGHFRRFWEHAAAPVRA
jgi:para-nitrobenzyl esterase